jgi:hypothetical protein
MSIEADNLEHQKRIEEQNQEIIKLLKAVVVGLEMINDLRFGDLIDFVED